MKNFNLENIQTGIRKVPIKALIYGPNGVGKSHFASQFPDPIFMDLEENIDHLSVAKHRLSNWWDALDFVRFLQNEDHAFKTLVVDSLDQLQSYARDVACEEVQVRNFNEGYGKAHIQLGHLFERFREECKVLFETKRMHLVFIAHCKIRTLQDIEYGEQSLVMPSLHDRVAPVFLDWCNLVGYAHRLLEIDRSVDIGHGREQRVLKETLSSTIGSRVLRVIETPSVLAKETFCLKTQEGKIPLSAPGLLKQIHSFYESTEKGE